MCVMNIVRLCELEGVRRFDADYYQLEYFSLIDKLKSVGAVPVKEVAVPVKRRFMPKEDEYFDYIEISDVDLVTGEFSTSRVVGVEAPNRAQWIVKEGDVLISTVNPIRNAVVLVRKGFDNLVASSGFCVLRPQRVSSEYLFIYFKTEFMRRLLNRYAITSEYPTIVWKDILNIPVYVPSESVQEVISTKVRRAFELLEQSKRFYFQAESFLLSELGLEGFELSEEHFYSVDLSRMSACCRMDVEFFDPGFDKMIERISKKAELVPLKNFIISVKRGVEVGSENYRDDGVPFIRVSNLSVNGLVSKDQKFISQELYEVLKDKFNPTEGEILLTKDAIPGIAYFVQERIQGIVSGGILRVNVVGIDPWYLCLCVNSVIGRLQIKKSVRGSVIPHLGLWYIRNLMVPVLPKEVQWEIAEFVRKSYDLRKEGIWLLKVLKREVERFIFETDSR